MKYRCDYPMATKKGIRQRCNKKCRDCLCAIKTNPDGSEEHVALVNGGSPNFTLRNLIVMSGNDRHARQDILRGEDRKGRRGRPIVLGGESVK